MAQRSVLKRVRVGIEPNPAAYGVDLTDTIADLFDLRVSLFEMTPDETAIQDNTLVQRIHQARPNQWGFSPVSGSIEAPLCSTDEILTSGVTATKDSTSKVLEAILGGYRTGEGSTVEAAPSPTATGFTVATGDGAEFIPGTIIGVETSAGSDRYVVAKVKTRSTDALTLATALPFTPASGAKVINAQLLYMAQIAPASSTSLQFLEEGEDRSIIRLALGCYATSFGLTWPLGESAMWSASFTGADWLEDSELGTSQGGAALAVATYDGSNQIPVVNGSVVLTPISGTTRNTPTISDIQVNPGVAWQSSPSYNGVGGIAQAVQVQGERKTITMLVDYDDTSWSTVRANGTKYQMIAQAGTVGGSILVLEVGTMVLDAEPKRETVNGSDRWRLVWAVLEDENCDDGGTDLERAPIRVGRL
jgi:hypothetical protein